MRPIADGVWQLIGRPPHLFNVYLMNDVLVDGATRWARHRILRQLQGREIRGVVLTHCHPDHQGVARPVCEKYGVPLACHEADVAAMEGRARMEPSNRILRLGEWVWAGKPHPVSRILHDGDEIAGFRVVHTPGHTPGHVVYFRESDGVAIVGDVLVNMNFVTFEPGLRLPPPMFCSNWAQNVQSAQRLMELEPRTLCFGHGPPLSDRAEIERLGERLRRC